MDLTEYRRELDELDEKLLDLFLTRLAICADIARYKQAHSLPVYDPAREWEKLDALTGACPAEAAEDVRALFEKVIFLCRAEEYRLLDRSAQSEGADL